MKRLKKKISISLILILLISTMQSYADVDLYTSELKSEALGINNNTDAIPLDNSYQITTGPAVVIDIDDSSKTEKTDGSIELDNVLKEIDTSRNSNLVEQSAIVKDDFKIWDKVDLYLDQNLSNFPLNYEDQMSLDKILEEIEYSYKTDLDRKICNNLFLFLKEYKLVEKDVQYVLTRALYDDEYLLNVFLFLSGDIPCKESNQFIDRFIRANLMSKIEPNQELRSITDGKLSAEITNKTISGAVIEITTERLGGVELLLEKKIDHEILQLLSRLKGFGYKVQTEWDYSSYYSNLTDASKTEVQLALGIDDEFLQYCSDKNINISETEFLHKNISLFELDMEESVEKFVVEKSKVKKLLQNGDMGESYNDEVIKESKNNISKDIPSFGLRSMVSMSRASGSGDIYYENRTFYDLKTYLPFSIKENNLLNVSPTSGSVNMDFNVGNLMFKDGSNFPLTLTYDSDMATTTEFYTNGVGEGVYCTRDIRAEHTGFYTGWRLNLPYFIPDVSRDWYTYRSMEDSYDYARFSGIYLSDGTYAPVSIDYDDYTVKFLNDRHNAEMEITLLKGSSKDIFENPMDKGIGVPYYAERIWDNKPTVRLKFKDGSEQYFNYNGKFLGGENANGEKYYIGYELLTYEDPITHKTAYYNRIDSIQTEYGDGINISYPNFLNPSGSTIFISQGKRSVRLGLKDVGSIKTIGRVTYINTPSSNNEIYDFDLSIKKTYMKMYKDGIARKYEADNFAINSVTYPTGAKTLLEYETDDGNVKDYEHRKLAVKKVSNVEDGQIKDIKLYEDIYNENQTKVYTMDSQGNIKSKNEYYPDGYGMPKTVYYYKDGGQNLYKSEYYCYSDGFLYYKRLSNGYNPIDNYHTEYQYSSDYKYNVSTITKNNVRTTHIDYTLRSSKPYRITNFINNKQIIKETTFDGEERRPIHEVITTDGVLSEDKWYAYNSENLLTSESISSNGLQYQVYYNYQSDPAIGSKIPNKINRYTVTKTVVASGSSFATTVNYDSLGQITSTVDSYGNKTENTYDKTGNLIKVLKPDGNSVSMEYDVHENNTKVVDENGLKLIKNYSPLGYLESESIESNGNLKTLSRFQYDENHNMISSTDGNGNTKTYEYNSIGELIKENFPNGTFKAYAVDHIGRTKVEVDNTGKTTTNFYDIDGNLIKTVLPDGATLNQTYDFYGRMLSQTDANGNATSYSYDPKGRVVRIVSPENVITDYKYNNNGQVLEKTAMSNLNANERYTSKKEYDGFGRLVSSIDEGGNKTSYQYDNNGNVQYVTTPDDKKIFNSYDGLNLLRATYYDNYVINYQYDATEKLIRKARCYKDNPGYVIDEVLYQYDNYGCMINENYVNHEINILDNSFSNSYTYDNNFNMISTTNKFGDTTSYNYDNMNRLSKVSMSGYNFTYNYDPYTNNISSIVYPNGTTYQFAFDSRNRLTNQNVSHPGTIWEAEGYTYDNNSNIIGKTHNGTSNSYAYDKLNRLITTNNVTNNNIVSYEYDSRSNINNEFSNKNIDFELVTGSYTWNGLGQLTSFTDSSNQVYNYNYDLNGLRSQKLKPNGSYTNYYYNKGGALLADETDGVKSSYINGTFPLAKITNGNIYYYIYNTHNDLKYITDSNGTIINEYTYDIWGKTTILREGIQNEIGYTSQIYDRESGNYYLRARYYNPQTKRFISKDSYEGTIENPVSHNMYIYCLNNPMIYSDSSGNIPVPVILYLYAVASSPDLQYDIQFIADDLASGNYLAALGDTVGMLIPGVSGVGKLTSESVESMSKSLKSSKAIEQNFDEIIKALKNSGLSEYVDDVMEFFGKGKVNITAGKNFKDHFIRHRNILENALGTKYPKFKTHGQQFLDDIGKIIDDGTVEFVGQGTLKKGQEAMNIYRGNGMTVVTKVNGEFVTLIKSGEGLDLGIQLID